MNKKMYNKVKTYLDDAIMADSEIVHEMTETILDLLQPNVMYEARVWSVLEYLDKTKKVFYNDYWEACQWAKSQLPCPECKTGEDPNQFSTRYYPSQGSTRSMVIRHEIN